MLSAKRKATDPIRGYRLLGALGDLLPDRVKPYLVPGIGGDLDAALTLAMMADEWRGYVALAAYLTGTPLPAYREILRFIWSRSHASLLDAVERDCRVVRRMLRSARFEHRLSGNFPVYRGVRGCGAGMAAKGLSWTLNRDVACWFAHRPGLPKSAPLVVTATIDASDIVYHSDTRDEAEVVLRRQVRADLDPEPATWQTAAKRQERRIRQMRWFLAGSLTSFGPADWYRFQSARPIAPIVENL
jgi:hypothetical protein